MKRDSYLSELAKLLAVEVDTLVDDFLLESSQLWDSLSIVSTIASIDNYYHVTVKGQEIMGCYTVGDIFNLIDKKLSYQNSVVLDGATK